MLKSTPTTSAPLADIAGWRLEHSYSELPGLFHEMVSPTPVKAPRLVLLNEALAHELGLSAQVLKGEVGAGIFAGNQLPAGARPLAQAYAGHQYGYFTMLGDGRALLLGEQITPAAGRFDVQLKGAGPTPFSRRGDGRAALGPMLREYIISEAMHALGIPTTRSLAVAATGETVWRREGQLPGAVLTRVAASHLRVGTFEYAADHGGESAVAALVHYTIRRHYPECADDRNPPLSLLHKVVARQAALLAQWMHVGFVHGVMNTDNMAISGETIDYGPCAFMDAYDPSTVFSSIDEHGRYSYGNQPRIAQWNLARLAEALLPVLHRQEAEAIAMANAAVTGFAEQYERTWLAGMRKKLGLFTEDLKDADLVRDLLSWMERTRADFTLTFVHLSTTELPILAEGEDPDFTRWKERWADRLRLQSESPMEALSLRQSHNPVFIPRNHHVERALLAAVAGELGPTMELLDVLSHPYDYLRDAPHYRKPGASGSEPYMTYCGT